MNEVLEPITFFLAYPTVKLNKYMIIIETISVRTYWIYLLPSTQQTIGYNGFTTCFDSHESSSGYVQNLLVLAVLLLTLLEVVGRYEVVAVFTLI
jgi:hypothetical protein